MRKIRFGKIHVNLKLYDIITFIFIGYMLSGNTESLYLYIGSGLFFVWGLCAFLNNQNAFCKVFLDKKTILLVILLIFNILTGVFNGGFLFTFKQFGGSILLFSPMLIFVYYYKLNNYSKMKLLFILSIMIYMFWCVKAILFYSKVENAARQIASQRQYYGDIAIGGGYGLAFGATLLSILFLELYLSYKKPSFVLTVTIFTILSIVIFQTKSTVTLVCWVVSLAVCMSYTKRINKQQGRRINLFRLALVIAIFTVILLLVCNLNQIGMFIVRATRGETDILSIRINSIGYALASEFNNEGALYFLDRMSIPLISLKVAIENPLLGIGWRNGNGAILLMNYRLGNHCEWFDALGMNGLIFGGIFIAIYVINFKNIFRDKSVKFSKSLVVELILLGTFNPFRTFQSQFVVFLVIPAMFYLISKKKENSDDKKMVKNKENFIS